MATQTDIVNMALLRIGAQQLLTDIDADAAAGNSAAIAAKAVWESERKFVLRDFNWPFARKYLQLTLEAGSPAVPVNPDWIYAYTYPTDSLFVRRLVTCAGRQECSPPPFVIGRASAGHRLIYTNLTSAMAEYTLDLQATTEFDESFTSMLAWRIAAKLGPSQSRMTDVVKFCEEQYALELAKAASRALAEGEYAIPSGDGNPRIRDIFNLAVTRIGVARNAAVVDPELNFAVLWPRVCFHDERDYVLRDFPWPFATKYGTLQLVAGTQDAPVNDDWTYAYRLPFDCLYARRIVTTMGRKETNPPPFRVGSKYELENEDVALTITLTASGWTTGDTITLTASSDLFLETEVGNEYRIVNGADSVNITITGYTSPTVVTGVPDVTVAVGLRNTALSTWIRHYDGLLVFTSYENAKLEYTRESEDPAEWDAMFISLLAWRLAALLAPSIAKGKNAENRAEYCTGAYELEKSRAQARALNEGQHEEQLDAEWIRGR